MLVAAPSILTAALSVILLSLVGVNNEGFEEGNVVPLSRTAARSRRWGLGQPCIATVIVSVCLQLQNFPVGPGRHRQALASMTDSLMT